MTEVSIDPRAPRAGPLPPPGDSAGALHWRLIWLYVAGSTAAVVVTFALVFIGLEFTTRQWLLLFALAAIVVPIYVAPDIYVIGRHYRPIGACLRALGEGRTPSPRQVSEAIARALNLPFYVLRARDLSARPGGDRPAGRRPGDRQCLLRGRLRRLADRDPCGDRVGVRLAGPRDLRVLRHLPRHHADDRAVVAALRRDRARPPQDADLDQAQEQASLPLDLHHRAAAPLPGGDHDAQGRTAGRGAWLRHWRNRDDAAHPLGRGHRLGLPGPGPVDVDPDRVRGLALGGNARERHAQGRRGPPPRPTQRHRNRRVRRPFPRLQLSAAST